jgi:hypothetical protein
VVVWLLLWDPNTTGRLKRLGWLDGQFHPTQAAAPYLVAGSRSFWPTLTIWVGDVKDVKVERV